MPLPCRRKGGGAKTGPTPTNRGKPGTKRHLVTDRQGIPLAELTTAAIVNETTVLERLLDAIPPLGGKRGRPRNPAEPRTRRLRIQFDSACCVV